MTPTTRQLFRSSAPRSRMVLSVLLLAFAPLMVILSLATAPAASAGTNGQQISLYDIRGDVYYVAISGTNQNNHPVTWPNPSGEYMPGHSLNVGGYWWVGTVYITGYNASHRALGTWSCVVPRSQASNWTTCNFD